MGAAHIFDVAVVAACACALYWNTLGAGYCLDDSSAIRDNLDLDSSKTTIRGVFSNDFWGDPLLSNSSNKSYRPLTVLTFRWTADIFGKGEDAAWAYHAGNIVLYAVVCALWHWFVARRDLVSRGGCLVSSLVFAFHPMHVENGASVVGRADVLGMIFMLASIDWYLRAAAERSPRAAAWFAAAVVACVASMLSKELGMLSLAIAAAFDLLLNGRVLRWGVRDEAMPKGMRDVAVRFALAAVISMGLLVAARKARGHMLSPSMTFIDNPIFYEKSSATRVMMYTHVHAWYLLLLFAPLWSCADWGYNVLPKPETPLAAVLAYLIVFGTPLCFLRTAYREKVALCTVLLVVPFLPASGIVPVGTVLAERLLLIPSTGFALGAGLLYDYVAGEEVWGPVAARGGAKLAAAAVNTKETKKEAQKEVKEAKKGKKDGKREVSKEGSGAPTGRALAVWGVVGAVLAWYAALTVERCYAWHSPMALFSQGIRDCPTSAKGHVQVGTVAMQNRNVSLGLAMFKRASEIAPNYRVPHMYLGRIYAEEMNDMEKAMVHFEESILPETEGLRPDDEVMLEYGKALCKVQRFDECVKVITQSVNDARGIGKDTPPMYADLATALGMAGRTEASLRTFEQLLMLPDLGRTEEHYCRWSGIYFSKAAKEQAKAKAQGKPADWTASQKELLNVVAVHCPHVVKKKQAASKQ
eukprot:TRINITY_DN4785_c0_g1_i4.p1 TRINITY_DN4785_c0_g1~~TRINITY_DN4785_c0_g1_i4.p1  ORF type:complete len:697 (+),score=198.44 TRINITY_DN4785_c0_g1_i4:78-2168(+)